MSAFMIYEFDEYAYYTGNSKEITIYDPVPRGWTKQTVPVIPEGHFAKFYDGHWINITQERPYPSSPPDWQPGPDPNVVAQEAQFVDPSTVEQTPPDII
jgi:hypothetical protein